MFRNFVISEDGKTSGIIVNIKNYNKLQNFEDKSKIEIEIYKDQIKKQTGKINRKNHRRFQV